MWHRNGRTQLGLAHRAVGSSVPSHPVAEESSPGTHQWEARDDTAARHDAATGRLGSLLDEQVHRVCSATAWGGKTSQVRGIGFVTWDKIGNLQKREGGGEKRLRERGKQENHSIAVMVEVMLSWQILAFKCALSASAACVSAWVVALYQQMWPVWALRCAPVSVNCALGATYEWQNFSFQVCSG